MAYRNVLALDIGASSGRGILGRFDGRRVTLTSVDRFDNFPVGVGDHLKWPIYYLSQSVLRTIAKGALECDGEISSIGIDTWGVDFGLIAEDGDFCLTPHHYRDRRTENILPIVDELYGIQRLFERTGISYQPFNTYLQLLSIARSRPDVFERAATFLMIPDVLTFLLTGNKSVEFTNVGTTQLAATDSKDWAKDVLGAFGIPASIMPPIHRPGDKTGSILPGVCESAGIQAIPTIAVASHDTASAAATQILPDDSTIFISSGTWSLFGTMVDSAITSVEANQARFNNEWAHNGKILFLKNIMGLWLLQECKREWGLRGTDLSYEDISISATISEPFRSVIDPDDSRFYSPQSMITTIQRYCKETRQPVPDTPGQIARTIYESLALDYRTTVEAISRFTNRSFSNLYVVGGGVRDDLLNKLTAAATGLPVYTGSAEASALGNILTQLYGIGELGGFDDFKSVIRESVDIRSFDETDTDPWQEPFQRFLDLQSRST